MKLQIFGSTGMLGQMVIREALASGHSIHTGMGRIEAVTAEKIEGDVVINCAGIVKQRKTRISRLMLANAVGPHKLAEEADTRGLRIIHISTDCVFAGGGPHYEFDAPDAQDAYALSKHAGEVTYGPHVTLRTSFVGFGAHGLIHDLQTLKRVSVSQNLLWTGHTVDTVAKAIIWIVERPQVTGLIHMPGTEQNRYTLARDLKAKWNFPAKLDKDDGFAADRRLASGKWDFMGLPSIPSFEEQLDTMAGPI